MNKHFNFRQIAQYYDSTLLWYRIYHRGSNGLHYGFSDSHTRTIQDAIINTNRFLAKKAKIKKTDYVLDAGCGIGGSAIWLAKTYPPIQIVGISLAKNQVIKAKKLSQREKVEKRTNFFVKNYQHTGFAYNTFDVVWAIESVCYANPKIAFLKEAYRVLKPGGRLIISDGFATRVPQTEKEKKTLHDFFEGFHLNDLTTATEFELLMKKAGFRNIHRWNKTKEIQPSVNHIYWYGALGYPFAILGYKLRLFPKTIVDNAKTAMAQKKGLEMNLGEYIVFYGEK